MPHQFLEPPQKSAFTYGVKKWICNFREDLATSKSATTPLINVIQTRKDKNFEKRYYITLYHKKQSNFDIS